jgi:hypothetical protein
MVLLSLAVFLYVNINPSVFSLITGLFIWFKLKSPSVEESPAIRWFYFIPCSVSLIEKSSWKCQKMREARRVCSQWRHADHVSYHTMTKIGFLHFCYIRSTTQLLSPQERISINHFNVYQTSESATQSDKWSVFIRDSSRIHSSVMSPLTNRVACRIVH